MEQEEQQNLTDIEPPRAISLDKIALRPGGFHAIDASVFTESLTGVPNYLDGVVAVQDAQGKVKKAWFVPQGVAYPPQFMEGTASTDTVLFLYFSASRGAVPVFSFPYLAEVELPSAETGILLNLYESSLVAGEFYREQQIKLVLKFFYLLTHQAYEKNAPEKADMLHRHLEDSRLMKLLNHIHRNLHQDLSLDEMGSVINLSGVYLSQYMKRTVSLSLQSYIIDQRLKMGLFFLVAGRGGVADVVANAGYVDQSYFNRRFKTVYNMRPLQLKKRYQLLFISRTLSRMAQQK